MRFEFSSKDGNEKFVSPEGYRIEKGKKETCYTVFDPKGKQFPEIFYYDKAAKQACRLDSKGLY